jgi:hypothetical protein
MSWETVAKCNECGKVKGEANKWFVIFPEYRSGSPNEGFLICHWNAELSRFHNAVIICSESCLQKRLGVFLTMRCKEAPANMQAEVTKVLGT